MQTTHRTRITANLTKRPPSFWNVAYWVSMGWSLYMIWALQR